MFRSFPRGVPPRYAAGYPVRRESSRLFLPTGSPLSRGRTDKSPMRFDRNMRRSARSRRREARGGTGRVLVERAARVVDQGGEDLAQEVAHAHDDVGTAENIAGLEQAFRGERGPELRKVAVEPPVTPGRHGMDDAVAVAAAVDDSGLGRPQVDVGRDRLFRQVDGRTGLEADPD